MAELCRFLRTFSLKLRPLAPAQLTVLRVRRAEF